MANKPPAFQFYPKDWLTSKAVIAMTATQRGYYIQLLAYAWDSERPGTLPNDPGIIWRLAGAASRREFEAKGGPVLEQFPVIRGGKRRENARLCSEYRGQLKRKETRSDNGRAGASARWHSNLHSKAINLPMAKHSSASASSTASAKLTTSPLPPADAGGEQMFSWHGETFAVQMGRRKRLPSLEMLSGGRVADVVSFLIRKGFRARIVVVQ